MESSPYSLLSTYYKLYFFYYHLTLNVIPRLNIDKFRHTNQAKAHRKNNVKIGYKKKHTVYAKLISFASTLNELVSLFAFADIYYILSICAFWG